MSSTDLVTVEKQLAELKAQVQSLQRQLAQTQKMSTVGALASSITHEFNNILTTVINYAKMGVRHKDAATRDKAFEKILAAGQRASKITTGLLSYARPQTDRREPIDLVVLVEDLLVLVEKDLQRHRVKLEFNVQGRPWAQVHAGQVQQVLLNLMVNARQAMPSGGILTIGLVANTEASLAEIYVKDTGCGIPADKLRQIFEPYYTTKTPDEHGQGGTGLGLSLAKDVMEAHGGRIRVESAPGVGTTFTLKFPLVAPATSSRPLQKVG